MFCPKSMDFQTDLVSIENLNPQSVILDCTRSLTSEEDQRILNVDQTLSLSRVGLCTCCINNQVSVDLSVLRTASVACSGMCDGSERIHVVVLSWRNAFNTAGLRTTSEQC